MHASRSLAARTAALATAGILTLGTSAALAQAPAGPSSASATAAAGSGTTLRLSVNGMVCAFCAQGIEARLKALPQTGALYISLKDKVVAVEPKAGQALPVDAIKSEVLEAGYDVTAATFVPQTVAEIRAAARSKR